jgi:hypothetical protein
MLGPVGRDAHGVRTQLRETNGTSAVPTGALMFEYCGSPLARGNRCSKALAGAVDVAFRSLADHHNGDGVGQNVSDIDPLVNSRSNGAI